MVPFRITVAISESHRVSTRKMVKLRTKEDLELQVDSLNLTEVIIVTF